MKTRAPSTAAQTPLFALLVYVLLGAQPLQAHIPVYSAGTLSRLVFQEARVLITFDLSYKGFWAEAEMFSMDTNRDDEVDREEGDRYVERRWQKKIRPALSCRIDGEPVDLQLLKCHHEQLVGGVYAAPFSLYYELQATPPEPFAIGEVHTLEFTDLVIKGETPGKPRFLIPFDEHGEKSDQVRFNPKFVKPPSHFFDTQDESHVLEGETLVVKFCFTERLEETESSDSSATPPPPEKGMEKAAAQPDSPESEEDRELQMLYAFSHYYDLSWWARIGFLLLAMLYGIGHAFTPGHGKAMVAAYLIGTKGRIRDAMTLGLTVTFSHTVAVFTIGLITFYLAYQAESSGGAIHNKALVLVSLASGLFFVGMGLMLFYRRWRGRETGHGHDHAHGHSHLHGHVHNHLNHHEHKPLFAQERPRLRELLALGLAAGVLPCPAGLVVIGFGLQQSFDNFDKVLYGIALLVFFSLGLAAVLVAVGVLMITGRMLAAGQLRDGVFFQEISFLKKVFASEFLKALDRLGVHLLRVLPALSCLFVAGLGLFFVVRTSIVGKVEIVDMARTVAGWLGSS
jgi:ABC-type nickel/cobalt efflux system permease component RcnA